VLAVSLFTVQSRQYIEKEADIMANNNFSGKEKLNSSASGCVGDVQIKDAIARLAREIYEKSGRAPGHDLDNWLKAEKQVFSSMKKFC
jgi:hypothetical protein